MGRHHSTACSSEGTFCPACALEKHVGRAIQAHGGVVVPKSILRGLRMIGRQFRVGRQEDSHEFLVRLLDAVVVGEGKGSLVDQMFGGRLRSRVQCSHCGKVSDTFDPFRDLSVDLRKQTTLEHALSRFFKAEKLDGDNKYRCSACQELRPATRQFSIDDCPPVLAIQLKRFRFNGYSEEKIGGHVPFPDLLSLSSFASSGGAYKLNALLVHQGFSTRLGHYYAFARGPNGSWYQFDDDSVHQVSWGRVRAQHAYILFYTLDTSAIPKPPLKEPCDAADEKKRRKREKRRLNKEAKRSAVSALPTTVPKKKFRPSASTALFPVPAWDGSGAAAMSKRAPLLANARINDQARLAQRLENPRDGLDAEMDIGHVPKVRRRKGPPRREEVNRFDLFQKMKKRHK